MPTQHSSRLSLELAQAAGFVVLEASAAEDAIGELIVLRRGGLPDVDRGWWRSGDQLAEALDSIGDPDLERIAAELRRLTPERNAVVHGLWLEIPGPARLNMKRNKSTKKQRLPASYALRAVETEKYFSQLADDFRKLEHLASDAVSDAMGLKRSTTSELPHRLRQ